ncbi:hypothetical protein E4K10_30085 [Streptomyces sp. T1317-0309]|nr:hypothetical protein E4K10_30085 [Streptomyces sp. T1317-0309]
MAPAAPCGADLAELPHGWGFAFRLLLDCGRTGRDGEHGHHEAQFALAEHALITELLVRHLLEVIAEQALAAAELLAACSRL